jgi:D-serine deaminase-like pyridoxal phosphate-dependent protein
MTTVGPTTKGFRLDAETPLAKLVGRPLSDDVFSWPLLTLDDAALEHNIEVAARVCAQRDVEHWPHVKTHMSRELWARQEAAGAAGATVATPVQLRTVHEWGARRALLANELLDVRDALWLRSALEGAGGLEEVWLEVDSSRGVEVLARAFEGASPDVVARLGVLVELGAPGARTGARTPSEVRELAAAVRNAGLQLLGVMGYEGAVAGTVDDAGRARAAAWCGEMRSAVAALAADGLVEGTPVVSAGGSAFLDVVLDELTPPLPDGVRPRVVVRSGAYVTHDQGHYERADPWARIEGAEPLRAAITVWGQVLSVPEPGLALLGVGRRDVSFDIDLPIPLWVRPVSEDGRAGAVRWLTGVRVTELNDQHAFVSLGGATLEPGDVVGLGISHPCTTLDKWRVAAVTRGDDVVDLYTFDF